MEGRQRTYRGRRESRAVGEVGLGLGCAVVVARRHVNVRRFRCIFQYCDGVMMGWNELQINNSVGSSAEDLDYIRDSP